MKALLVYNGGEKLNLWVKFLMYFEIIGEIEEVETMAVGGSIRDVMRLQKQLVAADGES